MKSKLLFVYNADTGFFNGLSDFAHKILSPKTYNCNLCKLTYGTTSMKKEWKSFIESLDVNIKFMHRNEFVELYPNFELIFPAVLSVNEDALKTVIHAEELNKTHSLEKLINLIVNYLQKH